MRVYTARIPYADITDADARAIIAPLPSVLEIVRTDSAHASHDTAALIVTTTDPSALVADVRDACYDDPNDESRIDFLD